MAFIRTAFYCCFEMYWYSYAEKAWIVWQRHRSFVQGRLQNLN